MACREKSADALVLPIQYSNPADSTAKAAAFHTQDRRRSTKATRRGGESGKLGEMRGMVKGCGTRSSGAGSAIASSAGAAITSSAGAAIASWAGTDATAAAFCFRGAGGAGLLGKDAMTNSWRVDVA